MSPALPLEVVLRERRYRRTIGSSCSITTRKTLTWQHAYCTWEKNSVEIKTNNFFFKSYLRFVMKSKIFRYCQTIKHYFMALLASLRGFFD